METKQQNTTSVTSNILSWLFSIIFLVVGVLNLVLVHPVPGIFYLLLAFFYLPLADTILKDTLGFKIPVVIKISLGLVVLWGTLAVGDLAEMAGL